jgi:hypothetical protein
MPAAKKHVCFASLAATGMSSDKSAQMRNAFEVVARGANIPHRKSIASCKVFWGPLSESLAP